jgi:hypothetical protein
MDTLTKTIATIVPERIPGFELEFEKDPKTGLYMDNYRATLTVKIGNDARKLHFNKTSKYHTSEYGLNEKGERVCLKESWDEELVGIDPYTHPFEDLEKLGIVVDTTALVDEYTSKLLVAMAEQDTLKREKFVKNYENSWIHKGLTEILTSKKYKGEVDVKKSEMGTYEEGSRTHQLTLTYKGQEVRVTKETVSVGGRHGGFEMRYKMEGRITPGYRGKYYRTLETCLVKFIAMVDQALAIQSATLTHAQKLEAERTAAAEKLGATFGMKASFTVEEKYCSNRRSYRDRNNKYTEVSYWLHSNGKKYKVANSYRNSEKGEPTFSIGGFGELSVEKVKAIIEILSK